MSTVFEQFIERRKEIKEMLDHFSGVVFDVMMSLSEHYALIDPVTNAPIMRVEREVVPDGSITVILKTSNNRSLTFFFQSNGEVRVVNSVGTDLLSEEYIDLTLTGEGETTVTSEQGEYPIHSYIYAWAQHVFED